MDQDWTYRRAVRVFRQKFTLEDAIGSHACSLEANTRVTNGIPLESSLLLPVCTVNCAQTLKVIATTMNNGFNTVRCAFVDSELHSRMPLGFTPLLRLKLLQVCAQWHSSRASTPLTGWHCKLHPNTEGRCHHCTVLGFEQTLAAPRAIRIHAGVGFVAMRVTPSA
jgi:hypothetical protein